MSPGAAPLGHSPAQSQWGRAHTNSMGKGSHTQGSMDSAHTECLQYGITGGSTDSISEYPTGQLGSARTLTPPRLFTPAQPNMREHERHLDRPYSPIRSDTRAHTQQAAAQSQYRTVRVSQYRTRAAAQSQYRTVRVSEYPSIALAPQLRANKSHH